MENILKFPDLKPKERPLEIKDVSCIEFKTRDNRIVYIKDHASIVKMMAFILHNKIKLMEEV